MTRFALVRVLGNDLVPMHAPTQTIDNLAFTLQNEPALEDCDKHFVLNRIVDSARETVLRAALSDAGVIVHCIPFEPAAYRRCRSFLEKMHYVTNNNPARNYALEAGRRTADYVLPFDGQMYFTARAWRSFADTVAGSAQAQVFVVPMYRVTANHALLSAAVDEDPGALEAAEPQLAFARDASERFDPGIPYGLAPKVDLLLRLGVPGPWDRWPAPYFARLRQMAVDRRVPNHGRTVTAGRVFRLASGTQAGAGDIGARNAARQASLQRLLQELDAGTGMR